MARVCHTAEGVVLPVDLGGDPGEPVRGDEQILQEAIEGVGHPEVYSLSI